MIKSGCPISNDPGEEMLLLSQFSYLWSSFRFLAEKPVYFTCIPILRKFGMLVRFAQRKSLQSLPTYILTYLVSCLPHIGSLKFTEMF